MPGELVDYLIRLYDYLKTGIKRGKMKIQKVPQDHISTYGGHNKAIYATDKDGNYAVVTSSGWFVEEEATKQALVELERQSNEAYKEVQAKNKSTLYYHMYAKRMNLIILSQSVNINQWRVKRHFKPNIFAKLPDSLLTLYGNVLGLSIVELKNLPSKEIK